jgi:photosystem II stability/assembly factor-like uncharacterized protein
MTVRYRLLLASLALTLLLIAIGLWWAADESAPRPAAGDEPDPRSTYQAFFFQDAPAPPQGTAAIPLDDLRGVAKALKGTDEDPFARLRYDWMRLRDPQTGTIPSGIREAELAYAQGLPKDFRKTTSWVQRGPGNVGGRTRALAYDVSDATSNTILAAGVSGGIWRTTDGGQTWTRVLDKGQRPSITSIAQDTRAGKTDTWYASTGERLGNSSSGGGGGFYRGNGVYKSTDGGLTWTVLPSTAGEPTQFDSVFDYTFGVRVDPSDMTRNEVYVAASNSIMRSIDGGQTWAQVLGGSGAYPEVEVTSTGVVYATLAFEGLNSGIYRSTDGVNWTNITPARFPNLNVVRTTIGVNPSDEDEVWFVAYVPGGGHGPSGDQGLGPNIDHVLWKYDHAEQGTSDEWTDYSAYLPTRGDGDVNSVGGATGDFNTQGAYDMFVKVHPEDGNMIFVGGRNLWRIDVTGTPGSADAWIGGYTFANNNFATYEPIGSDRQHPDQHALVFDPNDGDVMLTGSDGGVHRAVGNRTGGDGDVRYQSLNDGYYTTQFYHVCLNDDPADPMLMGGMQDNGTWFTQSEDPTVDWTEQFGGDGAFCEITNAATRSGTARYPSVQNGRVTRWDYDATGNLTAAFFIQPSGASNVLFIHPFEIDPVARDVLYYPGGTSMWRSQNAEADPRFMPGLAWEEISGAAASGHVITAVRASDGNDDHVLYYGTVDGNDGDGLDAGKLYRLDNANTVDVTTAAPVEITGANFPAGGYVSSIAVDPTNSDEVLVAFSNYNVVSLFYSSDGGQTWTDVEGNLAGTNLGGGLSSGPSLRWVDVLPQPGFNQTTYYVGTSVGLYSTTSLNGSATSWVQEGPTTIGAVVVDHVEARPADGLVVAGTHANGVFSSDVPLPVEFAGFDAQIRGRDVELQWTTASETNNAAFHVEHRAGAAGDFTTLHRMPGAGTTTDARTYRYRVDGLTAGSHTFRIRQVDVDGRSSLSDERGVVLAPDGAFELIGAAPNPFRTSTRFRLTLRETQDVRAAVYNAIGQHVRTVFDGEVRANDPVDLQLTASGLSSGVYFLRVEGDSFTTTRRATLVR